MQFSILDRNSFEYSFQKLLQFFMVLKINHFQLSVLTAFANIIKIKKLELKITKFYYDKTTEKNRDLEPIFLLTTSFVGGIFL